MLSYSWMDPDERSGGSAATPSVKETAPQQHAGGDRKSILKPLNRRRIKLTQSASSGSLFEHMNRLNVELLWLFQGLSHDGGERWKMLLTLPVCEKKLDVTARMRSAGVWEPSVILSRHSNVGFNPYIFNLLLGGKCFTETRSTFSQHILFIKKTFQEKLYTLVCHIYNTQYLSWFFFYFYTWSILSFLKPAFSNSWFGWHHTRHNLADQRFLVHQFVVL